MAKDLSIESYGKYMNTINSVIKETESRIKYLPRHKQISNLSYKEWVMFQQGKLKLK